MHGALPVPSTAEAQKPRKRDRRWRRLRHTDGFRDGSRIPSPGGGTEAGRRRFGGGQGMTHDRPVWARAVGGAVATAALIAAMSGTALAQDSSMAPAASIPVPAAPFVIGYSNGGGVGNGFREEQVCTAKAEATALG